MEISIIQTDIEVADLSNKKQFISHLRNVATLFSQLDDATLSDNKFILAKKWSTLTDDDVAGFGLTRQDILDYINLMTQFGRLMTNLDTTPLQGRTIADKMRSI